MDITELRTIIRSHLSGGALTLTTADLGPGAAGTLLTTWFQGTLSIRAAQAHDTDTGLQIDGTLSWLGVTDRPVTGLAFTIDPADQAPALFLALPLTTDWHFGTSFPATAASALDGLLFAAPPRLLLTSVPRPADHDHPALPAGLSFHATAVKPPAALHDLAALLPPATGDDDLTLFGPIQPGRAGAGPNIRLSSAARDSGTTLGASFALWAGSQPDSPGRPGPGPTGPGPEGGSAQAYGVGLSAVLAVSETVHLTLCADADAPRPVVLSAKTLPDGLVPTTLLAAWPGTGAALEQITAAELSLSEKVTLSAADLTIDPTQLAAGGLTKALTAVSVTLATTPDFCWHVLDTPDLALTGAGATLSVAAPLLSTRTAAVTAHADFLVADSVRLNATAEIPPGAFTLASAPEDKVELTDVLRHFLPTTDLSAIPRMTLTGFNGTVQPTLHSYALGAQVETDVPVPIGAATLTLTAIGAEFWHYAYPEKPVTGAHLSAVASLAPTAHAEQALTFHAEWWTPATFRLAATLPDIALTELLSHLAADAGLPLPENLPTITLKAPAAAVQRHTRGGYEFAVDTTAEFDGTTGLGLVGKAATGGNGTVFAAALWQDDWTWSPKDVRDWPDLGILDALTFGRSGLAVSTADGQHIDGTKTPPNLPATVDKGLTFFTEITFSESGGLGFLHKLFPGADRITLTALLAAQVKESRFTATIGAASMQKGFGELRLTVKPASYSVSLATSFVLDVSSLDTSTAPGNGALQFTGSGSVSKSSTGWEFSLTFILQGAAGAVPGTIAAERLVLTLDAPGHYLPAPAPAADLPAPLRRDGATGTSPAWKNAFGIDGFDIDDFYLGLDYGSGVFSLGGGGSVTIASSTRLELAVYGSFEPPDVSAFYFALTADTPADHGVTLYDIVGIVGTPPAMLDFLKQIVLNELALCAVTVPGGWTNRVTTEQWDQGFYAKGDIDFFHNSWRFKVRISATGLYVKSDVAEPMTIGSVLTLSDATGTRGPQYLFDLSDFKTKIPEKVFAISGKIAILGVSASLDATLGTNGFTFRADLDLKILTSHLDCTLGKEGLSAAATVQLDFDIPAPKGIPDILAVHLAGALTLHAGPDGASVALSLSGHASLLGENVGDLTLTPSFSITSFDDLTAELSGSPEAIWKQLGDVFWESVGKCAMTKASDAM
ncbi:hypothetical protein ACFRAR_04275 [Kitasatospora sp. NPDC056651]|uniref:hypothetical protein n=1 Tax=Kitasatospora sp. NPDC056651 TaxID=3345892 RepID=UPI0036BA7369